MSNFNQKQTPPSLNLGSGDLSDKQNMSQIPECSKLSSTGFQIDKKRITNRNSGDQMYQNSGKRVGLPLIGSILSDEDKNLQRNLALNKGRRQFVSRNTSNNGSNNIVAPGQIKNKSANNIWFNSNDSSSDGRMLSRMQFEEQRMSTQGRSTQLTFSFWWSKHRHTKFWVLRSKFQPWIELNLRILEGTVWIDQ